MCKQTYFSKCWPHEFSLHLTKSCGRLNHPLTPARKFVVVLKSHASSAFYNRGWPWPPTPIGFRLHEEWFQSIVYPLKDKDWILETYSCRKTLVVKTKVWDVWIQMLIFSDSENGCTQGSFLKRLHARAFLGIDVRNQNGHFDGCTQRSFG